MTAVASESKDRMEAETRGEGLSREILVLGGVVVLGTIMTVLDLTIVNVAVPTLGRDFVTSISTIQWVLTGYMLAFASVIPLLFMLGSALAGAAPQRMGRVMSVIGVPMLLAPVFGPVIGGLIIDQISWRWIFYINLPIGIAALIAAQRLLPEAKPRLGQRLDLRGLTLLSPGIAIFLYGMSEAGNRGGFGNARTIAAATIGLALVALFVWHASVRGKAALIDVSLFRRRGFAAAAATNLLLVIALFGSLILLPLYYQVVRHETPLEVGLLLAPQGLGAALAMPLAGSMTDKIGARVVVSVGMVVAVLGMLAYTQVGPDTSYLALAAALLVVGLGIGSTIMPAMAAAFQTLSREQTPRGTSALNAIQRIGGAIGSALLAIILQRAIAANLPDLHGGIQGLSSLSQAERVHSAPALADAFGTTFWVAVGLIAVSLVPALLLPRAPREHEASADEPVAEQRMAA
jgi:EmrB/QacA subfamily drug resistance transporter